MLKNSPGPPDLARKARLDPPIVRLATNDDIPSVVHVIKTVYDEYGFAWEPDGYHADLYDLEAAYAATGDTFWVAEVSGVVLATVAFERFSTIPGFLGQTILFNDKVRVAGCNGSLERLYVHPQGRRQGLGLLLLDTVILQARAESRENLEIWSDKKFTAAHRLYQRRNARVVGDRLCDDIDKSPEWGLLLAISNL